MTTLKKLYALDPTVETKSSLYKKIAEIMPDSTVASTEVLVDALKSQPINKNRVITDWYFGEL